MRETAILLWFTIAVAVVFDFTNGFHDTANAIATSISTRALSPRAAVGLSAVFNLVGAVVTVACFQAAGIFAVLLTVVVYRAGWRPAPVNRTLRGVQVVTSAYLSFSHGANDAQKTMAAITLALVASGDLPKFQVPLWVVALSAAAIGFGTYAGGWRIIRTMGWSILKLEPATAMSAQLMGATVIQAAT